MSKYLSHFLIKIEGRNVSEEFYDALEEVLVDSSLHLPDMFTIRLHDPDLSWVDSPLLDIGKDVEIAVIVDEESAISSRPQSLTKGEITALEPEFSATGKTSMVVRGYDRSHRLHRGRKTRTFLRIKDSDLARKLAGEAGLGADVDATTVTYDFVMQYNQTNMEFLTARAERIGFQVYVADGKLHFKKGDYVSGGRSPQLTYMEDLIKFEPRWTASQQVSKMIVRGWDAKGKTPIASQERPNRRLNQGGMRQTGGDQTEKAFKSAEEIIVDVPVSTVDEARALARGLRDDISREFVQAEGTCNGHPGIKAGGRVTIKGVGSRFSGEYRVTGAIHLYTAHGYETRFSITGRQPNTLSHLLESGNGHGAQGLVPGLVTGLVTNLGDPDNLGRVKVKYGWLGKSPGGTEIESDWVRIAAPMAGAGRGLFYLPEINDEVLLAFEHGDIHRPYIVGALWNNKDKPPKPNNQVVKNGRVNQRVLKSRSGHLIILDDTANQEQIIIQDKTGKNKIVIDSKKNSITIDVAKDLSSKAGGTTTIQSSGKMTLKSTGDLTLECRNFNVKAQQNANLKANVAVNLQNAAAKIAMSGPTVNINNGALEVI